VARADNEQRDDVDVDVIAEEALPLQITQSRRHGHLDSVRGDRPLDQHLSELAQHLADGIRWVEKGLAGFFQMLTGTTLLALGVSIALGDRFPRWLGWVGAAAGVGSLAGGTATAHTGFSPEASLTLLPGTLLSLVFLLGVCTAVWRRGGGGLDPRTTA
jgi:hypothetical protein